MSFIFELSLSREYRNTSGSGFPLPNSPSMRMFWKKVRRLKRLIFAVCNSLAPFVMSAIRNPFDWKYLRVSIALGKGCISCSRRIEK